MQGLRSEYQLAAWDTTPRVGESRIVLWMGSGMHRFDYPANGWVVDGDMMHIFLGSPDVIPITEEQARWTIEHFGGTWAVPPAPSDS